MIEKTAVVLKALGEPTRLKIIKLLSVRELCICELVAILQMSQPSISQHVKVLKQAGLVNERRFRQNSFLSLNSKVLGDMMIEPFSTLMQTDLDKIPGLKAETVRYLELDNNEEVIACKSGKQTSNLVQGF